MMALFPRGSKGIEHPLFLGCKECLPFTFALLVALTAFEILVAFLQAFIFTILSAVYIGGSMHPDH